MSQEGYVQEKIENGISIIEFFHPKSNSMPSNLLAELANTITKAGENSAIKVIVLRSGGEKAFCAGASFDELLSIEDEIAGTKFFSGFANVINSIRKVPKLVIARVHGKAVGGGVGIAAAADYCLASNAASIKLSELAIGIGPFVIGPAVERKVGLSAFSALTINATQWKEAMWAFEKGLYKEVFSNTEELDKRVEELSNELANRSSLAMENIKKMLWQGTSEWDTLLKERAIQSGTLVLSPQTKSTLEAFKKK